MKLVNERLDKVEIVARNAFDAERRDGFSKKMRKRNSVESLMFVRVIGNVLPLCRFGRVRSPIAKLAALLAEIKIPAAGRSL